MSLSREDHERAAQIITGVIESGRLPEMLDEAYRDLERWRGIAFRRRLTREEDHETNVLIELVARAEGAMRGGGWFFRFRKRLELTAKYFR